MPHDEFFEVYKRILTKTFAKLKNNRFAAIVTSEVRAKNGEYIALVPNTIKLMQDAGFMYWNEIILINPAGTLPQRVGRYMSATRKTGRQHQNVLIFYKGDPNKIRLELGEVEIPMEGGEDE
jgi:DNA modification methylase